MVSPQQMCPNPNQTTSGAVSHSPPVYVCVSRNCWGSQCVCARVAIQLSVCVYVFINLPGLLLNRLRPCDGDASAFAQLKMEFRVCECRSVWVRACVCVCVCAANPLSQITTLTCQEPFWPGCTFSNVLRVREPAAKLPHYVATGCFSPIHVSTHARHATPHARQPAPPPVKRSSSLMLITAPSNLPQVLRAL